ncbi:hypothetical protein [Mycobacteroides immunogenum]|nr:hypothetical protein [Mycobacteroides immunogenum]
MSMDFAVIPAVFATAEEALKTSSAIYDEPGDPPARVVDENGDF